MADDKRSWSSLSADSSPFAGTTFRRGGLEESIIVAVPVAGGESLGIQKFIRRARRVVGSLQFWLFLNLLGILVIELKNENSLFHSYLSYEIVNDH